MLAQATASSCHALARGAAVDQRHLPEATWLYRTLQQHWLDFLAESEAGGGELPAFVRDEFAAHLRYGIFNSSKPGEMAPRTSCSPRTS